MEVAAVTETEKLVVPGPTLVTLYWCHHHNHWTHCRHTSKSKHSFVITVICCPAVAHVYCLPFPPVANIDLWHDLGKNVDIPPSGPDWLLRTQRLLNNHRIYSTESQLSIYLRPVIDDALWEAAIEHGVSVSYKICHGQISGLSLGP